MAKKKSVDAVTEYTRAVEAAAESPDTAGQALATAKTRLVRSMNDVLGPLLAPKNDDVAMALADGSLTLTDAMKQKQVDFRYETTARGDEAANQLSTLTEILETDRELAMDIVRGIFNKKVSSIGREKKESAIVETTALVHLEKGDKHALVQYLSSSNINHGHALNALVSLEPAVGREVIEGLPNELQTGFLVGQLTIDDVRAVGLMGPQRLADQVLAQFEADQDLREGFSDRGNMTAASLLFKILEEKSELGGTQRLEGILVLLLIGKEKRSEILNFKYGKGTRRGGDTEAATAAQGGIREIIRDLSRDRSDLESARAHFRDIRAEAAKKPVTATKAETEQQALRVLTQETNLDDL